MEHWSPFLRTASQNLMIQIGTKLIAVGDTRVIDPARYYWLPLLVMFLVTSLLLQNS